MLASCDRCCFFEELIVYVVIWPPIASMEAAWLVQVRNHRLTKPDAADTQKPLKINPELAKLSLSEVQNLDGKKS